MGNMTEWYVARATNDVLAEKAMGRRGYTVYRPVMPQTARDRLGNPKQESRSMFPRYIFVQPHNQGWEPLRAHSRRIISKRSVELLAIAS